MSIRKPVSIQRNLISTLLLIIVILSGSILLTASVYIRRAIRTLSHAVISQTIAQTEIELNGFFQPAVQELLTAGDWVKGGMVGIKDSAALNRIFNPLIQRHPHISAVVLANAAGNEYFLTQTADKWIHREIRAGQWDGQSKITEWSDKDGLAETNWKKLSYDPHQRPWYRGAMHLLESRKPSAGADQTESIYWTRPYTFFTTKDPGITAAMAFDDGTGDAQVIGFDIRLNDITEFTMGLRVTEHGKVIVLSDDDFRVLGLPRDARFRDAAKRRPYFLKKPGELGIPILHAIVDTMGRKNQPMDSIFQMEMNGETWWTGIRPFTLSKERKLHITVVVPESDLLGDLQRFRFFVWVITLAVLAVAILSALRLAKRYSRPVEALMDESGRISRGDLEPGEPITSRVVEFQQLSQAHNRMREGLRELLKLERDIQLARQIQVDTFPRRLPDLKDYRITAWNEPAEGAAGDIYDVMGFEKSIDDDAFRLSENHADIAVFLLADATGHGIGPALTATQLRAMLRMAVRTGWDLPPIVKSMNEQLYADLKEGRFITAWFGILDPENHRLKSFSAGQGPLFRFTSKDQSCHVYSADAPPFGVIEDISVSPSEPYPMNPGDLFVVLSDGLIEPSDAQGNLFGKERVMELIRAHHAAEPEDILTALQDAIREFTGDAPLEDDCTAIIIKRE